MHGIDTTIAVHVLHGDALVAAGLAATLRECRDMVQCAGLARPGPQRPVDVVIADYECGLALLAQGRAGQCDAGPGHRTGAAVLILSQRDTEFEVRHALEQGARGYLVLGCGVEELLAAVRALRAGLRHIGGKAAQRLADSVAFEALTGREQAVLRLLVQGLGNKAIAHRLGIAMGTVKSHLKAIFQKLNAGSRTEVAAVAERRGLLTAPPQLPAPHGPAWAASGGLARQAAVIRRPVDARHVLQGALGA